MGSAPAGVLLAGFPSAPESHVEWTSSHHPERRLPNRRISWTYQDWGIFLADSAASEDWSPFFNIFGKETMTPRIITLDLMDIVPQLIAPNQSYWVWKDTMLPVIGDLSEFRLHRYTLPLYLAKRDEDRATRAMPAKWTTLNIASLALLPIGRTWKSIKRFCCITYDKYAHGRNRAKGKGDPQCAVCQVNDSLLHILCVCNRPSLYVSFVLRRHFNL
jgi:hypothetical protein